MKKINELPLAVEMPQEDEWVLPICKDKTAYGVSKISICALADAIRDAVLSTGEVKMEIIGDGIKFSKKEI